MTHKSLIPLIIEAASKSTDLAYNVNLDQARIIDADLFIQHLKEAMVDEHVGMSSTPNPFEKPCRTS